MSDERSSGRRALVWATLGFALLTVILTWPSAANFSRTVAGFKGLDSLQYTWSLWWSGYAWRELGHSPSQVTHLYHPWGGQHPLLDVTPMLDWLALPMHGRLSPTEVYNTLFLASFVLSGVSMYLLALDVTRRPLPAFYAGAIYAFFPNRMGHALSGHLTQLVAWWFPLYLLYLLRTFDQPTWRNAVLGGVFLALSLYVALVQTAYFVVPATVLVMAYCLLARRRQLTRRHLVAGGVLFGLAAILVVPKYGPFMWETWREGVQFAAPGAIDHSADTLVSFLPPPFHPFWGRVVGRVPAMSRLFPEPNELEHTTFLGWTPVLLALLALERRRKNSGLWLFVGLVSFWLSLGPVLRVGGRVTGLAQPYALLARLPFYRWGRTPERFNELTMLCLALLAAQGLASLGVSRVAKASIVVLTLTEMMVLWPFPTGTPEPPGILASWVSDDGAVLNLPIRKRQIGNLAMYYQTKHHRPIVGGYIHRELPGMRAYVKAIDAAVTDQTQDAKRTLTAAELRGLLQGLDVRRVLVHREFVGEEWVAAVAERLTAAVGPATMDLSTAVAYDVLPSLPKAVPLAAFAGSIGLVGLEATPQRVEAGQPVTITCRWQAMARPEGDYTIFVHLIDHRGERVAQHDGQPLGGNWPTTLWAPGETLVDQRAIRTPSHMPAGRYQVGVGLYDVGSRERLPVQTTGLVEHDMLLFPNVLEVTRESR